MSQEIKEVKVILDSELNLYSLVPRLNGDIVVACEDGSVYRVDKDGIKHKLFTVGGQASGVAMDQKSGKLVVNRCKSVLGRYCSPGYPYS